MQKIFNRVKQLFPLSSKRIAKVTEEYQTSKL